MKSFKSPIEFKVTPALLTLFALGSFALCQSTHAVVPAPDGGYPGGNTAEGQNALFSLTSGSYNTAVGFFSLRSDTAGSYNTAVGAGTLLFNTADSNTAVGIAALLFNTAGDSNTAVGQFALSNNTEGAQNTAMGESALLENTMGTGNVAVGVSALRHSNGNDNVAIGHDAGVVISGGGNICIGSGVTGVAGESNTIRIGDNLPAQSSCYIGGIYNHSIGLTGLNVLIDATGRLGTFVPPSADSVREIKPMNTASEAILAVKPVTFHYKTDNTSTPQFGLIAEEVAAVDPDLVVRDKTGELIGVRHDAVNAMLLNEFLKEHKRVEELKKNFEITVAQQQKDIQDLTAQLRHQAAQIHKVSEQVEMRKPEPQVALVTR